MTDNMAIYNQVRVVPEDAKKPISAGKLKGFTNINPQHRYETLTRVFGPCGEGWKIEVRDQRLHPLGDGQVACFVDIELSYRTASGEWSAPVPGTGGSMFVAQTSKGLQVSDECFKMALTDAISVAYKYLGGCADVYYKQDATKYGAFGSGYAPDMYDYGYAPQQPQTYQPQAQPAYSQPQYAAPAQPVPTQPVYEQPTQYAQPQPVAQPAAPQSVPVTEAMTGGSPAPAIPAAPQAGISLDEAKAVICSVGYNKGKTLGDILNDTRAMDFLGWVEAQAADPREKEAAGLLKRSLFM